MLISWNFSHIYDPNCRQFIVIEILWAHLQIVFHGNLYIHWRINWFEVWIRFQSPRKCWNNVFAAFFLHIYYLSWCMIDYLEVLNCSPKKGANIAIDCFSTFFGMIGHHTASWVHKLGALQTPLCPTTIGFKDFLIIKHQRVLPWTITLKPSISRTVHDQG